MTGIGRVHYICIKKLTALLHSYGHKDVEHHELYRLGFKRTRLNIGGESDLAIICAVIEPGGTVGCALFIEGCKHFSITDERHPGFSSGSRDHIK